MVVPTQPGGTVFILERVAWENFQPAPSSKTHAVHTTS
jgi:hypothetical protein